MARPATLAIRITADASAAQRGAQRAQGAFTRLGQTMKNLAVTAGAVALGGGITTFARDAVRAASEVQQNFGALDAVFKRNSGQMKAWANSAAESVGLSKGQYAGLASTLGATLKNLGISQSDLGGTTDKLIRQAADLASMFGGTTQEAVEALTAAFRGETDPIERYGISINQAAVKAYKASHASQNLTDTQARMALIFQQSKDAAGNFGREADTLQGQQQRLAAQFDNLKAAVGERLLPVLTQLAAWANSSVLPAFSAFGTWLMGTGVPAVTAFATAAWNLVTTLGRIAVTVLQVAAPFAAFALVLAGPYLAAVIAANVQGLVWVARLGLQAAAMTVVRGVTVAWAAAQWALNAAMTANPIGLIIAAIAALAVGVLLAYQRFGWFRTAVQAVWAACQTAASFIAGVFVAAWNALVAAVNWATRNVRTIIKVLGLIFLPGPLKLIVTQFGRITDAGRKVVSAVQRVISWLRRIAVPGALRALRTGFNGVRSAVGFVIDKVRSLIGWLKKLPGGGVLSKIVGAVTRSAPTPDATSLTLARARFTPLGHLRPGATVLRPNLGVTVTIDGQQLQGRITRTVNSALRADGARLAAGGWA